MTPEREAQMREMYGKEFPRPSRYSAACLHEAWHYRLEGFLSCARALEPMVRDGELLEKLRQKLECDGFGYWLPEICLKEIPPEVEGVGTPPTQEEFREALDAAMSAALEDGNAIE